MGERKLKTEAGAECVVLATDVWYSDWNGRRGWVRKRDEGEWYRETHYFLELAPGQVLVATCSGASDSKKLDAIFEASMKTLRLEKR